MPSGKGWTDRARMNPPDAATSWPESSALSTGILGDGLVAVDIDIDDSSITAIVLQAALHYLGESPKRIRRDSSRCLLLYQASEGEPSKRSISGTVGKVEALGSGQQFVAFGVHPSGAAYEWAPCAPDAFDRDKLLPVSKDALSAFLEAVAPYIGAEAPAQPSPLPVAISSDASAHMVTDSDREWATIVIEKIGCELDGMPEGSGRNNALNVGGFSAGTLVGNGSLPYDVAEARLILSAERDGHTKKHGMAQTRATIQSGLNAGMNKPRPLRSAEVPDIDLGPMIANGIAAYKARQSAKPEKAWPDTLNSDAYIGIAGDFIRLVAPHTEGDPCALLIA